MVSSEQVGQEFLAHYGVKGMKWGVRKASGGRRSKGDAKAIAKRKKIVQKRRNLSDDDLNKYIERLSKEKKLKDLINEDVAPGKTVAKRIMGDSGQKVARTVVAGAALYGIKVAVSGKFDAGDAANYVAPRPKNK